MSKRITIFFSVLMFLFCFVLVSIYRISTGEMFCDAESNQSCYRIDVSKMRGLIFDYKKRPLVGIGENDLYATVLPTTESINEISRIFPRDQTEKLLPKFSLGQPFKLKLTRGLDESTDIKVFKISKRYAKNQLLPHIIGYVNDEGDGVSGIEFSYNDYLKQTGAEISVKYKVDAFGKALKGDMPQVHNTSYLQTKGVVLTIDKSIQQIVQNISHDLLKKGAVIVTEVPTCKIRACISMPEFSPLDLESALKDDGSPFINRAFSAYNIGSVFKLVTSATALECGIKQEFSYDCCGKHCVDGTVFHCFNGNAHGTVDMKEAITKSCNTYFIKLCENIRPIKIIEMSKALGLSNSIELAPGFKTANGNLPTDFEIRKKIVLANVSFGQGPLMATPIQVSAIINAIASEGIYMEPQLVEGLVNEKLDFVEGQKTKPEKRVMSNETANFLMDSMRASVQRGTSTQGNPSEGGAGAKTATAETGVIHDGHKVIQAWYAGFFPAFKPKYCIVVLAEDAVGGGESCGPLFKAITEKLVAENL